MIPKIIHQTWKNDDVPSHNIFCVESWKTLNPEYEYKWWTDEDIINFVKEEYPDFVGVVNNFKLGIIKSDFFRLLVLYHFGGVYVDIDFECLKPIKEWELDENKINVATEPVEHNHLHGISDFIICNALIASPPKKEIILEFIKNANLVNYNYPFEVLFSYGPLAWTSLYKTSLLQQHLHFLDSQQFYPIPDISNPAITYEKIPKQNYINLIKNREYNSCAVHYWDHCNHDRDNILKLYGSYYNS